MSSVTSLAKRGFEAAIGSGNGNGNGQPRKIDLPTWGILMLGTTALFFFAAMFMVEYTFGRIIPTLLMIESPQDNIDFEPLPTEDTDDTMPKDPETTQAQATFITSSFRKSLRLLQSVGGFRARFRGFSVYFVQSMVIQWIAGIISVLPIINFLGRGFATIVAAVVCAQFSLLWTHIVISEPSPKTWFRRFPSIKMWRKVALPTAIFALAEQIAVMVPIYIAFASGLTDNPEQLSELTPHQRTMMALGGFGSVVLGLFLSCVLVIPATVMLTRVQASLLSDAEETIVPFDRSFGGKVIPEIVGGSGVVGMLDAWKTFDWSARIRLGKTYLKVFLMQLGLSALFTICIVAQLFIILGKDWSKLLPEDGNKN